MRCRFGHEATAKLSVDLLSVQPPLITTAKLVI
jgi:hypothetical protein